MAKIQQKQFFVCPSNNFKYILFSAAFVLLIMFSFPLTQAFSQANITPVDIFIFSGLLYRGHLLIPC